MVSEVLTPLLAWHRRLAQLHVKADFVLTPKRMKSISFHGVGIF